MQFETVGELFARVDAERDRIRAGRQAVGPWRIVLARGVIEHTREPDYEIDLSRVTTPADAVRQIARAAEKHDAWMSDADVGALVRLFDWLELLPHG